MRRRSILVSVFLVLTFALPSMAQHKFCLLANNWLAAGRGQTGSHQGPCGGSRYRRRTAESPSDAARL